MSRRLPMVLFAAVVALATASLHLHEVEPDVPAADELLIRVTQDGTIQFWHGPTRRTRVQLPFRPNRWDDVESLRDGELGDGVGDMITTAMNNRLAELTTALRERAPRVRVEADPRAPSGSMFLVLRVLRSAWPTIPAVRLALDPDEEGIDYELVVDTDLPIVGAYMLVDRRADDPQTLDWFLGTRDLAFGSLDPMPGTRIDRRAVGDPDPVRRPLVVGVDGQIADATGLARAAVAIHEVGRDDSFAGLRVGPLEQDAGEGVARLWTLPWGVWHQILEVIDGTDGPDLAIDCLLLMDETP